MPKDTRSELDYWLAFYLIKGLGFQTAAFLLEKFSFNEIFSHSSQQLAHIKLQEALRQAFINFDWQLVDNLHTQCEQASIQIVHYDHPYYPQLLKETPNPPFVLFCIGDLQLLNLPKLAIVGARNATENGRQVSQDIAGGLVANDFCVVSGMARGIDSCAHKGALAGDGKTIAVLGTGTDVCYPARAKSLYHEIKEKGLLLSEYLPGSKALAMNFPRRNRIISGLSLGCIVVEAELKSGSLISAKYALEQNREVFAVPGSVFNHMAKGCHALIKQGAKLIENCDDIFTELSVLPKTCLYKVDEVKKYVEQDSILKHLSADVMSVDKLQHLTGLAMDELLPKLLDLELAGKVVRVLDGYTRIGRS